MRAIFYITSIVALAAQAVQAVNLTEDSTEASSLSQVEFPPWPLEADKKEEDDDVYKAEAVEGKTPATPVKVKPAIPGVVYVSDYRGKPISAKKKETPEQAKRRREEKARLAKKQIAKAAAEARAA